MPPHVRKTIWNWNPVMDPNISMRILEKKVAIGPLWRIPRVPLLPVRNPHEFPLLPARLPIFLAPDGGGAGVAREAAQAPLPSRIVHFVPWLIKPATPFLNLCL
jgi:hypothetical protein